MRRQNSAILLVLALFCGILFFPAKTTPASPISIIFSLPLALKPEALQAQNALVLDLTSDTVLFEKNPDAVVALASLTKIVTMLAIADRLYPTDRVLIGKTAVVTEGDSALKVGERFLVKDLMALAMNESSNDATVALVEEVARRNNVDPSAAEHWFLEKMQQKVTSFGISDMKFLNTTGLDISKTEVGAYGSARDIMKIAAKSYHSFLWKLGTVFSIVSEEGNVITIKSTNKIAGDIVGLVSAKTGFTDLAGGNLLVLLEHPIGQPIGIVVLGSSAEGRFEDIQTILKYIQ